MRTRLYATIAAAVILLIALGCGFHVPVRTLMVSLILH